MPRLILCCAAAALLAVPAASQDARELLRKVAGNYQSLGFFEVVEVEHQTNVTAGRKYETETRRTVAAAPGNRGRFEWEGLVMIYDGERIWSYSRDRNEYTRRPASGHPILPRTAERRTLRDPGTTREEAVELETGTVLCWVVEGKDEYTASDGVKWTISRAYWIDKARLLVLKSREDNVSQQQGTQNTVTQSIVKASWGKPLPDSLFRFVPPEGAVEVEQFSVWPKSPLLGSPLPDFELQGPGGMVLAPASLRGKYAVLYFAWTKEDELAPFIELLHRAYKGQELVVATILTSPPGSAPELSSLGYTMPVAPDTDGALFSKLELQSRMVLIVQPDGKVVFAQISSGHETPRLIVSVLRKAGVW